MAAEELLSLKWNNHQSHFMDILTFLRKKEMFIDATIACGGKVYSAHKFVLSTCSDYFKQIFTRNPCSNPIVYMKDVSCHDIEALLDFMYNGEVNVPQSSLGSLIKTAEGLQIKGLAVPDDPPASRREQDRDKRERDPNSTYLENRSPPPKRRIRERISPHRRNSNIQQQHHQQQQQQQQQHHTQHNRLSGAPQVETTIDDPSSNRTSSPMADDVNIKSNSNGSNNSHRHSMVEPEEGDEDRGHDSGAEDSATVNNRINSTNTTDHGPGTSTDTIPSKQEDMDIKQEDVVELAEEDDDGDWGGGGGMVDDGGGDGGGNDSLSSADNTVNFSDVLLPHNNDGGSMAAAGGAGANVGDSAMGRMGFLANLPMLAMQSDYYRPHQCSFCGRCFKRKDHKAEHERIHTGEKPYSCTQCNRSFVQKQQLVSHNRRRHGAVTPRVTSQVYPNETTVSPTFSSTSASASHKVHSESASIQYYDHNRQSFGDDLDCSVAGPSADTNNSSSISNSINSNVMNVSELSDVVDDNRSLVSEQAGGISWPAVDLPLAQLTALAQAPRTSRNAP